MLYHLVSTAVSDIAGISSSLPWILIYYALSFWSLFVLRWPRTVNIFFRFTYRVQRVGDSEASLASDPSTYGNCGQ
jgi:hypothetical protein